MTHWQADVHRMSLGKPNEKVRSKISSKLFFFFNFSNTSRWSHFSEMKKKKHHDSMRVRGPGMVKFMLTHFNVVLLNLHFIFSPFPWNLFHLPRPTTLQWARVSTMTALAVRPPTQVVGGFTSLFWRADNFMNSHKKRGKSGVKKYYSYFTPRWALSNANRFIAFVHYFEYIVAR